jgi:hypothetical protein
VVALSAFHIRLGLIAAFLSSAACATPVRVEGEAEDGLSLRRIALVPSAVLGGREVAVEPSGLIEEEGPYVVTAQLLRELEGSGRYEPIRPEEVLRVLGTREIDLSSAPPATVCQIVSRELGADAILFTRVRRFVSRRGRGTGVARPASVWFELALRAPDGELLWRGEYDETQQGLTDDPLSLRRSIARRFRWVTAEELARYGAGELVGRMPGSP